VLVICRKLRIADLPVNWGLVQRGRLLGLGFDMSHGILLFLHLWPVRTVSLLWLSKEADMSSQVLEQSSSCFRLRQLCERTRCQTWRQSEFVAIVTPCKQYHKARSSKVGQGTGGQVPGTASSYTVPQTAQFCRTMRKTPLGRGSRSLRSHFGGQETVKSSCQPCSSNSSDRGGWLAAFTSHKRGSDESGERVPGMLTKLWGYWGRMPSHSGGLVYARILSPAVTRGHNVLSHNLEE
jgi:hypothetical protein